MWPRTTFISLAVLAGLSASTASGEVTPIASSLYLKATAQVSQSETDIATDSQTNTLSPLSANVFASETPINVTAQGSMDATWSLAAAGDVTIDYQIDFYTDGITSSAAVSAIAAHGEPWGWTYSFIPDVDSELVLDYDIAGTSGSAIRVIFDGEPEESLGTSGAGSFIRSLSEDTPHTISVFFFEGISGQGASTRTRQADLSWTINATTTCGNDVIEPGEQCDDGNNDPGDCCSSTCQFEAGEGSPSCCDAGMCRVGETCGQFCFNFATCFVGATGDCLCAQ